MFCSNCGHKNPPNSKFCEACGKPITGSAPTKTVRAAGKTPWKKYASVGAVIVLICFFLPWVMVSCSGGMFGNDVEIRISGWEFATGKIRELDDLYSLSNSLQGMMGEYGYDGSTGSSDIGEPLLFLVPVLALGGLLVLSNLQGNSVIASICGGIGILGLIIFAIGIGQAKEEMAMGTYGMLDMRYQFGYFMTWVGFIIQTAAGLIKQPK